MCLCCVEVYIDMDDDDDDEDDLDWPSEGLVYVLNSMSVSNMSFSLTSNSMVAGFFRV